jgi:hypothetical protein
MVPAGISLGVLVLFVLFFTDNKHSAAHSRTGEAVPE